MAQVPLTSSFEGDFILKLVVVEEDDTMDEVARKTAEHSAGRTVRARPGLLRVRRQGASIPLERDATVREAGLTAMDAIEVYHQVPLRQP
jgi:toluene monooxygenase system protein B